MNSKKPFEISEKLTGDIISVAYGEASFIVRRKVNKLALENDNVRLLLEDYRKTAESVKLIKPDKCPADVISAVHNRIDPNTEEARSFLGDLFSIYFQRPVLSAAAAALIIFAILTSVFLNIDHESAPSAAELELANKQVYESLALVGEVLRKSELIVGKEIFSERVGRPLKKGMNEISYLFN